MDVEIAFQIAGHGNRSISNVEDLIGTWKLYGNRKKMGRKFRGRHAKARGIGEEIIECCLSLMIRKQKTAAAEAGQCRFGDTTGKSRGCSGVEGIASLPHNIDRGFAD